MWKPKWPWASRGTDQSATVDGTGQAETGPWVFGHDWAVDSGADSGRRLEDLTAQEEADLAAYVVSKAEYEAEAATYLAAMGAAEADYDGRAVDDADELMWVGDPTGWVGIGGDWFAPAEDVDDAT